MTTPHCPPTLFPASLITGWGPTPRRGLPSLLILWGRSKHAHGRPESRFSPRICSPWERGGTPCGPSRRILQLRTRSRGTQTMRQARRTSDMKKCIADMAGAAFSATPKEGRDSGFAALGPPGHWPGGTASVCMANHWPPCSGMSLPSWAEAAMLSSENSFVTGEGCQVSEQHRGGDGNWRPSLT